ncbi:iron-sulfur cluster assembly scaffold protein [Parvularcula marina]|uniref:Iron-sulfur cluster assembly scaffold protein n=1 Tax=Parvularcula marina TaxID=2292771 RepID=A0A371RI03_9PROT|nr:iron-sulfur cluster assembly scaffold protein [Parvularcula marina]RFB05060.1 iron-sulfur cluster assembly scaffold protein [Parvularcula marina]
MLSDLYSGDLLEAAASIPPRADLPEADARARKVSRVCGSEVDLAIKAEDGIVTDIALDVKACALGQASSSMFARAVRGASLEELITLRDEMTAMLKEEGPAPSGERWAELEKLLPIREYPARHTSTLLIFEAAADCAEQLLRAAL